MDLSALLAQAFQGNQDATAQLEAAEKDNLTMYLGSLATQLNNGEMNVSLRTLCALLIKKSLESKDPDVKVAKRDAYTAIEAAAREEIKRLLLNALFSEQRDVSRAASQAVAKIAVIELPAGAWPDLIPGLLAKMTTEGTLDHVKEATLLTLGYICDEIETGVLKKDSDLILTAITQGMCAAESAESVRFEATKALSNALVFADANMQVKAERDALMQVICETTTSKTEKIRVAAFDCLVSVASLYYGLMTEYMVPLYNATMQAMANDSDEVCQSAIEFWSTLCDEELEMIEWGEEEQQNMHYVKGACKDLVPALLSQLTKQDEDVDRDDEHWDVAMAASTCLALVAKTVGDDVVAHVVPYVVSNVTNSDWHYKEAAVMAFGSVLEGPDPQALSSLIDEGIGVMVGCLKDSSVHVKDTAAWALGRICKFHMDHVLTEKHFNVVIQAISEGLTDVPRVAASVCWALHALCEEIKDEASEVGMQMLTPVYQRVMELLISTIERRDAHEAKLRVGAFETVNSMVLVAPKDHLQILAQLTTYACDTLLKTFDMAVVSAEDKKIKEQMQASLCSTLHMLTPVLGANMVSQADVIMELYIRAISTNVASVQEEALLGISAMAGVTNAAFSKYLQVLMPYVFEALRNAEEYELCELAVGLVSEVYGACGKDMVPYGDQIVTLLLEALTNKSIKVRDVRPPILSCFGDIALAIAGQFDKYVPTVMEMLKFASETQVDVSDLDQIDYLNSLRVGIFDASTGILQGLKDDQKQALFVPYSTWMINFIGSIFNEEHDPHARVIRGAVGVLGDLAHTLGSDVKASINQQFVSKIITSALQSDDEETKEVAVWAKDVIVAVVSA